MATIRAVTRSPSLPLRSVLSRVLQIETEADRGFLRESLEYHFSAKGGENRARIASHAAFALGLDENDAFLIAASVELLHNASLIQDDLQDRSEDRRKLPTVWRKFGESTAIALTDFLISSSYRLLADLSRPEKLPACLDCIHTTIHQSLQGQTRDLRNNEAVSAKDCLEIAAAKSGPLFSLALEMPLRASGNASFTSLARNAAFAFGKGYQIYDDLKDYEADKTGLAGANLVLVLAEKQSLTSAIKQARLQAYNNLSEAQTAASQLPYGSGRELVRLAHRLQGKLEELPGG